MVLLPYEAGAISIEVDVTSFVDFGQANHKHYFPLVNTETKEKLVVVGVVGQSTLQVLPTKYSGQIGDTIKHSKSDLSQNLIAQQPIYRRNVCNFMPSLRFSPPQMLIFETNCLLQHRLSGPVDSTEFTLFFVAKTYSSMGSSPWPLFTALDSESNWSYSIQAVMEQRNNTNLEARWKIACGVVSLTNHLHFFKFFDFSILQRDQRKQTASTQLASIF
jgi:hypothetical protein